MPHPDPGTSRPGSAQPCHRSIARGAASSKPASAHGLLFAGERKGYMSACYLQVRFKTARKSLGLPELTIHGLRHSALTLAGQHGTADRDRMLAEKQRETVASSTAWAELLKHP